MPRHSWKIAAVTWLCLVVMGCGDYSIAESDHDNDGWTQEEGDCDDLDGDIHPAATETCNTLDDNCDGQVDEGFDTDGDGVSACGPDGVPRDRGRRLRRR